MNNTFNVNYMTKTYNSFVNNYEAKIYGSSGTGFADSVREKIAERAGAAQSESTPDAVAASRDRAVIASRDRMTMGEYKQFIYDKISQIPIHPSQAGWNWNIEITEEGFEAMKNDLAYEEHVLNSVRVNFSKVDFFGSSNYSILHFDATEEESYGIGWSAGNPALQQSESSFWDRRAQRKEEMKEQLEEWLDKRAMARRWQQEQLDQAIGVRNAQRQHFMTSGEGEEKMLPAADIYEPNIAAILMDTVHGEVLNG